MKPRFTSPDANQAGLIKAAKKIPGVSVIDLHEVGDDCPDCLLGYKGRNYLVEIKTRTGRIQPGQAEFSETWTGQTSTIRTLDELLSVLGIAHIC